MPITFYSVQLQIPDSLTLPFGEEFLSFLTFAYWLYWSYGKMIGRRQLLRCSKSSISVSLCPSIRLYRNCIVCHRPSGVAHHRLSSQPQGRHLLLVVYGNMQCVLALWHRKPLGHAEHIAVIVDFDAVLSFGPDFHILGLGEFHSFHILHSLFMAVSTPESRIERPTLRAQIVYFVAHPNIHIAGIPYPRLGCHLHSHCNHSN